MAVRVAELCGHLPIALRVVAERAVGRPGLSMTELVEELTSERRRLDGLALALAEDERQDQVAARPGDLPLEEALRLLDMAHMFEKNLRFECTFDL